MRNFLHQLIIITLTVAIGTWGLSALGMFKAYDALIYDLAVRHSPLTPSASPLLLLTATDEERQAGDTLWLNALDQLEALGARQIVFTFTPGQVSTRFYQRAAQAGNLVFGRALQLADQTDDIHIAPWPDAAAPVADRLNFGLMALPAAQLGVYRQSQVRYRINDQDYPALETQAAIQAMGANHPLPDADYWVNFKGGPEHLPMIPLHNLLAGQLISELVRGKSVVIGPALPINGPGMHSPVDRDDYQGISPLAFHGFALQTLLLGQAIHPIPAPWQLLILLVLAILNVLLYQLGRYQFGLWLTVGAIGVYALLAWLLPTWLLIWPPFTALLVTQVATFLLVWRDKLHAEEAATRQVVLELSGRLEEKLSIPGFYATKEPWSQVVNLVRQTLDLDWLIFLERFPEQYHVKEVIALNCSFADIDERRRDYRRQPYSDAIAENRPTRLEQRLFFKPQPGIRQYLTPLAFGGELLGFWVLGIAAEKEAAAPDFSTIARDFSQQIAEMLYHRRHWQRQQEIANSSRLLRYLNWAGGTSLNNALRQAVTLYTQRVMELERIFESIGTAAIYYNVFGQAIQVNPAMANLMTRGHLLGYEMTTLDLLCKLCSIPPEEGPRILQRVLIAHESTTLPAMIPGDRSHWYILHVRPVLNDSRETPTKSADPESEYALDAAPFDLRGILVELTDVTTLHHLSEAKSNLIDHTFSRLRNDFQSIVIVADLLTSHLADPAEATSYARTIEQEIAGSINRINAAQDYLCSDLPGAHDVGCYPTSPREPLLIALQAVADQLQQKRLDVKSTFPTLTGLAMANPRALQAILQTIMEILIEDALRGTCVTISITEQEHLITYHFSDHGVGLAETQFENYLHGRRDETGTAPGGRLRVAVRQIADWSGRLEGTSRRGEGLSFKLTLRCFA